MTRADHGCCRAKPGSIAPGGAESAGRDWNWKGGSAISRPGTDRQGKPLGWGENEEGTPTKRPWNPWTESNGEARGVTQTIDFAWRGSAGYRLQREGLRFAGRRLSRRSGEATKADGGQGARPRDAGAKRWN